MIWFWWCVQHLCFVDKGRSAEDSRAVTGKTTRRRCKACEPQLFQRVEFFDGDWNFCKRKKNKLLTSLSSCVCTSYQLFPGVLRAQTCTSDLSCGYQQQCLDTGTRELSKDSRHKWMQHCRPWRQQGRCLACRQSTWGWQSNQTWNILVYLLLSLCAPTCTSDWSWCTSPGDLEGFFSEDISGAPPTRCWCRDHLWPCAGRDGGPPALVWEDLTICSSWHGGWQESCQWQGTAFCLVVWLAFAQLLRLARPELLDPWFFFSLHCRTSARHCRSTTGMSEERNQISPKAKANKNKHTNQTTPTKQNTTHKNQTRQRSREICKQGETGETSASLSSPSQVLFRQVVLPHVVHVRCLQYQCRHQDTQASLEHLVDVTFWADTCHL